MLAATNNLTNLRASSHDAVEVLREQIAPRALDEVLVLFPDPWHKKRHHKRRLIQPPFVELIASRLATGGVLRLATDWEEYALQMLEVVARARSSPTSRPRATGCRVPKNARRRVLKSAARVSVTESGTSRFAGSLPDQDLALLDHAVIPGDPQRVIAGGNFFGAQVDRGAVERLLGPHQPRARP